MIPIFVIFLREGIEGAMIVAILLAYLKQIERRDRFSDVYLGVAAALGLAAIFGVVAYFAISRYAGSSVQTYFETATYLVATFALTGMTFWMQRHARTLSKELRARATDSLNGRQRLGLSLVAFQAVGREGVETMVFTLAILFANAHQGPGVNVHGAPLIVGAVAGLAVAIAMSVWIYRLGARLNLALFFRVLGGALLLFGAGLLADAIENLQQLGWIHLGNHVMWNSAGVLSESSNLGDIFHSLLGYADRPTLLQASVWVIYLIVALGLFLRATRPRPRLELGAR